MDNKKTNEYYIAHILKDIQFLFEHTKDITEENIDNDEVLLDSIMFRLVQISESSSKLTDDFKARHKEIAWQAIKGMRNKIVHEYGDIELSIVYTTVKNDIPELYKQLLKI